MASLMRVRAPSVSTLRVRAPGRVCSAPRPPRLSFQCRAGAAVNVELVNELSDRLLTLEAELARMFDSGKPIPKAAVVNAHREEISLLKSELAQLVEGKVPPPRPTPALKSENDKAAEEIPPEVEALERARLLLDGNIQQWEWGDEKEAERTLELALMEAENERLRRQARSLLERQLELEQALKLARSGKVQEAMTHLFAKASAPQEEPETNWIEYALAEQFAEEQEAAQEAAVAVPA